MSKLIVSATYQEIAPLVKHLKISPPNTNENNLLSNGTLDILITGIGILNTTYHLTKQLLSKKYDEAINIGICGAYNKSLNIGEVVNINEDRLGDLGADDNGKFLDSFELGLESPDSFPLKNGKFINPSIEDNGLKKVSGITVNKVNGEESAIQAMIDKYHPDVESMESAAFFYCCLQEQVPFSAIRAISNYVEPRNRDNWKINKAIKNLNQETLTFI